MNPEAARDFNRRAGKWWSELHRAGRRCGRTERRATRERSLARVWEKQKRGLAHVHGVLAAGSPDEVAWAREYVTALRELAPSKGFGFVDGWHKVGRKLWPGEQAGAYLSSYFVQGKGLKAPITENVFAGDLPRLVVFVGRDLTQQTRCTMRMLRQVRRLWAWRHGLIEEHGMDEEEVLAAACLEARLPPPPRSP